MLKTPLAISLLLVALHVSSQEKAVCFTVDDLPTVTYRVPGYQHKYDITTALVQAFVDHDVPAIGYVNEGKLYSGDLLDSSMVRLLDFWLSNGLELGNHTHSHLNYHRVAFEDYQADILKGEPITKALMEKYQQRLRYFRHPYLRSGANQAQSDSLQAFLAKHGYEEAPVTIDNDDYLFAHAYGTAYVLKNHELMATIGSDYLQYMEEKLLYFERQATRLFGRNISQILLIHANLLNAHYLGGLIGIYEKHGYQFISQEEALEDPAYHEAITFFGDYGISWIDRWALSRGKRGDFFKGDPVTPKYITEIPQQYPGD